MDPEQVQDLIDKLFEIGGAVASKGWELAIRQVYVDLSIMIIWTFICLIVGIILLSLGIRRYMTEKYFDDNVGVCICFGVVLIVVSFVVVSFAMPNIINPEWVAVQKLLLTVSGNG